MERRRGLSRIAAAKDRVDAAQSRGRPMNAICRAMVEIECEAAPQEVVPDFLAGAVPENDLAFYQRRALEESAAAQRARCAKAAAAHRSRRSPS